MEIKNHTPFTVGWTVTLDKQAAEHVVVGVKGTWSITDDGRLTLLEKQPPLLAVDEFHGEPGKSSIRYAAELGPCKPATDVALVGDAVAPKGRASSQTVSLRVGPLAKKLNVFGDRGWWGFLAWRWKTAPRPYERMPLVYENASGGEDPTPGDEKQRGRDARNPLGRGYRARGSKLRWSQLAPPNLEAPGKPFGTPGRKLPPPAGFGFIGRDWAPRLEYAGTYDEAWMKSRLPLLPLDFDERFHNSAHPDLVADGYLRGDEPVEVVGCTRNGTLRFALPGGAPAVDVRFADARRTVTMNLETVLIDTAEMQLRMVWKGELEAHGRVPSLHFIECQKAAVAR